MGYIQKETKETCHNLKGRSKEFCLCNGKKNCARHEVYIILSTYLPHETTCIRIKQHSYQFCRRQNCAWRNTKYVFILYNEHTHIHTHTEWRHCTPLLELSTTSTWVTHLATAPFHPSTFSVPLENSFLPPFLKGRQRSPLV